MESWIKISIILCSFGFFRALTPSDPFLTEFITGKWRNVTSEQVNREVYPISTYAYLAQLVIVFLITDIVRYKPIIVLSAALSIVMYVIFIWTTSMTFLQISQILFGTYLAAEVAYLTYMYAKVERDKYQKVTGFARAAIQIGHFTASITGQLIVSFKLMNLKELHYVTLGAQSVSLIFALALPAVGVSLYFYTAPKINEADINSQTHQSSSDLVVQKITPQFSIKRAVKLMFKHFIDAYTNPTVVQWSIWWALAMAGYHLIYVYSQLLYQQIDPNLENFYNGAVEAVSTFLGALSAFAAGSINSLYIERYNMWILTACSLFEGIFIVVASQVDSIIIVYILYVMFAALYTFMITMASSEVAKNLAMDSFGLVFGINSMIALVIQTVMTVIFVSGTVYKFDPKRQFLVFGSYFLTISIIFFIATVVSFLRKK